MDPEKLSLMEEDEYKELVENQYLCRISYLGDKYPQIKPFLYIAEKNNIHILASKYGKKLKFLEENPKVALEIEEYSEDLSDYKFVTLHGTLSKVEDEDSCKRIREKFVELIRNRDLSRNVMRALGHSKDEPLESIVEGPKTYVYELIDVEKVVGFKE